MRSSRYIAIVLGQYDGMDNDFNTIADENTGVNYVDGNGIWIGTFYSIYETIEISELLAHIPALLIFDITDKKTNQIHLPSKYYKGLFPEIEETLDNMLDILNVEKPTEVSKEEYDNIDDILDKLSRNEYDRSCLTEKEIEILEKSS